VKSYEGANIRNVALVGHSHSGKTSLASAMLYTSGAVPKLLHVSEGNTITDYEEEEIARLMTLSAAAAAPGLSTGPLGPGFTAGFQVIDA